MRRKVLDIVTGAEGLVAVTIVGALLAGTGAYATTKWTIVGSSTAQTQSVTVSNLVISAVVSPAATNLLYPGENSDVVVTISNPNPYPVTIAAVNLPKNTTYATGYTTGSVTTTKRGCLSTTPSDVVWSYSTTISGSSHILAKTLTVAADGQANNPLTVTFVDDVTMTLEAPAACEDTYFSMPAMTGVVATNGAANITTSPTIDSWSS
jgi:hypothetical protein